MKTPVEQGEDTDRHAAVRLEHLSPTWVRFLDTLLGEAKQKNGGYLRIETVFESGKVRWFDVLQRYLKW